MLNYSGESYYVLSHYGNVCQFVYGQVMFRILLLINFIKQRKINKQYHIYV